MDLIRRSLLKESKHLEKLTKQQNVACFLLIRFRIIDDNTKICSRHERFGLKPFCSSSKILNFSRPLRSLLFSMKLKPLHGLHERDGSII